MWIQGLAGISGQCFRCSHQELARSRKGEMLLAEEEERLFYLISF